jgi:SMC interacting uncharacterized protein involved in chromosome segregation
MAKKEFDGLDESIRKMLRSLQGDEIDEKIEGKFEELRGEMDSTLKSQSSRGSAALDELKDRLGKLESGMAKMDARLKEFSREKEERLTRAVKAEMERLSSDSVKETARSRELMAELQSHVSEAKGLSGELRVLAETIRQLDVDGIRRDLESLKQKASWLEHSIKPTEIENIHLRIDEIESQLKGMRLGSPMVIE